jgi:hypothetical protein
LSLLRSTTYLYKVKVNFHNLILKFTSDMNLGYTSEYFLNKFSIQKLFQMHKKNQFFDKKLTNKKVTIQITDRNNIPYFYNSTDRNLVIINIS